MLSLIGEELSVCHRWLLIGCAHCFVLICGWRYCKWRAVTWLVEWIFERWVLGWPMRFVVRELECGAGRAKSSDWEELEDRMELVEA